MDADFIIVGAGLAGLSFAVRLLPILEANHQRLILLDHVKHSAQDKHWCGWNINPHPFQHLVKKSWSVIRTGQAQRIKVHTLKSARYQMIASQDFYKDCFQALERSNQVTLNLNQTVGELSAHHVRADQQVYQGRFVLDARGPKKNMSLEQNPSALLQCFCGWHIKAHYDVFDSNMAHYMEFDANQKDGIFFHYCLPISSREALIEPTYFLHHGQIPSKERFFKAACQFLEERYQLIDFDIVNFETGALPMVHMKPKVISGVYPIGSGSGLLRPATGYAFDGIQHQQNQMIEYYKLHQTLPNITPYRPSTLWMDKVFLKVLKHKPERGADIFVELFENASIERIIRFLSDKGSILDKLSIIRSVPTWPFIKALVT